MIRQYRPSRSAQESKDYPKASPARKLIKNQDGQIAFIIGAMMVTFFSLSLFVINTGVLVSAKINLQNAADMAAFAGASTQARQMNQISFLNYEMRRNYKKFIFRYYVLGNMAQATQPGVTPGGDPSGANDQRSWRPQAPTPTDPNPDSYEVPAVCIAFNEQDNYCQRAILPSTPRVTNNPINAIAATTFAAQSQLEQIRQDNCGLVSYTNYSALIFWLYKTDPEGESLLRRIQAISDSNPAVGTEGAEVQKALRIVRGLTFGVGLVPKMLMLRQRIKSIATYMNEPSDDDITLDKIIGLRQNGNERAAAERKINAFLSAYQTLGDFNFPDGGISMEELMPNNTMIRLNDMRFDFTTYFVAFPTDPAVPVELPPPLNQGSTDPRDCVGTAVPINVPNFTVGVSKDPNFLTYYAIKLKARVSGLLGSAALGLGPINLVAYSAAKPFGSRIGPPLQNDGLGQFLRNARPPRLDPAIAVFPIPNLPVERGDNAQNQGWNKNKVLRAMFGLVSPELIGFVGDQNAVRGDVITFDDVKNGLQIAMAPNPAEMGLYNIPNNALALVGNDSSGDKFTRFFDEGANVAGGRQLDYTTWAPIIPRSALADGEDLEALIAGFLQEATTNGDQFVQEALGREFGVYLSRIRSNQNSNSVEGNEGFYTYTYQNPLKYLQPQNGVTAVTNNIGDPTIIMSDNAPNVGAFGLNSSWSDVKEASLTNQVGRTGYSVKFVSFDTINNPNTQATGNRSIGGTWTNFVDLGPAQGLLKH